jgi:hypothetical protein
VKAYVTEKALKQGQNITLDDTLKALLVVPEGVQVTFLNIQKYLNQHYIKPEKPVVEKKPTGKKSARPATAR